MFKALQSRISLLGLPKGSVLSPILFNIYTATLEASLSNGTKVLEYADDLALYVSGSDLSALKCQMNGTLKRVSIWLTSMGFSLSSNKSTWMLFCKRRNFSAFTLQCGDEPII